MIQPLVGYALTGETVEHILTLFIGSRANGKSTLTDTMLKALQENVKEAKIGADDPLVRSLFYTAGNNDDESGGEEDRQENLGDDSC